MTETPDILKKIIARKKEEVLAARVRRPLSELRSLLAQAGGTRGFVNALLAAEEEGRTPIIAEVKKGSPSKGVIRADFDPVVIAETYEENGAACLSVLTDVDFFLGRLEYLAEIRKCVGLPLLRKDFICDPYQIAEARAAGADAVLLIATMLDLAQLRDFTALARELSLDVLLEVHDERELEAALQVNCELIGINNRDLRRFVTDLGTTERLARLVPGNRLIVAESGIHRRADIDRLLGAGARAFLVGESLMRETDIGAKLRELAGS